LDLQPRCVCFTVRQSLQTDRYIAATNPPNAVKEYTSKYFIPSHLNTQLTLINIVL